MPGGCLEGIYGTPGSLRIDPMCLNFDDCLVGVWRVYGYCLEGIWQVSGGYLAGVLWLSGGCLKGVWKVS